MSGVHGFWVCCGQVTCGYCESHSTEIFTFVAQDSSEEESSDEEEEAPKKAAVKQAPAKAEEEESSEEEVSPLIMPEVNLPC